ncbi:hypothetical protein IKG48_00160 [Candidatus Saccharibacteria bacterium]|nr:hypothetical protein [Candidatus Saccharibacteria bacterium]
MEKRTKKLNKIIIILAVAFVATGGIFLYKFAYEKGKTDGRQNYESETSILVKNLATAVSEKVEDSKNISENLNNVPSELDQDSINSQIEALGKIELKNETAKTILNSLKDAWQALKTTYEAGDNDKIKTEFENLKSTAKETAEKLQTLYDENITSALEKL